MSTLNRNYDYGFNEPETFVSLAKQNNIQYKETRKSDIKRTELGAFLSEEYNCPITDLAWLNLPTRCNDTSTSGSTVTSGSTSGDTTSSSGDTATGE